MSQFSNSCLVCQAVVNFFYGARSSAVGPTPNLGDQVTVFMFLSDSVAQLYPQAPGSLFIAFYDTLGHHRDILTRLHTF
jgi:hypothetical protein